MLRLNIALLLLVSLEPYLFNLMVFGEAGQSLGVFLDATSTMYALCLGGIWLILGALHHHAAKGDEPMKMIQMRNYRLVDAGIFFLSAAPVFWEIDLLSIPIRFLMWFLTIPSGMVLDAVKKVMR